VKSQVHSGEPGALIVELVDRVRCLPHRAVVVELRVGNVGTYDKAAGRFPQYVDLCVIVAAPGWTDSRYQPVVLACLPANDAAELSAARSLAQALAERLALPCHTSAVRPDRHGSLGPAWRSPWIAAQGPAPSVDYEVRWEAAFWLDDGVPQTATGVETTSAGRGRDACLQTIRALLARVGSDYGPIRLRASIPAMPENPDRGERWPGGHIESWGNNPPRRRLDATSEELRGLRRSGVGPAEILRSLGNRETTGAGPTAVALMWALHEAFVLHAVVEHPMEELATIGPWLAGALSDADLDAALGPWLDRAEWHWNMAHRLGEAHRSGLSVAAVLRAYKARGAIFLISKLDEAFRISGGGVAMEIVAAMDSKGDRAIDARLNAVL
jgi:hypothetical protein